MRQTETAECGLACLAIAASAFGANIELASLRQKYQISSRGMTLREIKEIAADMNMVGRAVRCEVDQLAELKCPALLHWELKHFVVLDKVKGMTFHIHDPARGRIKLYASEVSRKFSGAALELTEAKGFVKRKEPSPLSLKSWFRFIPEMYGPLIHIMILSLLLQCYILASPFYLQLAIDQAAHKGDKSILTVLAFGFGLLCVFNAGATLLRGIVVTRLTALLNWDMTVRLFRHMIRLPLPWYQRRRLADILSRFDSINEIRELLSGALVAVLVDGILAVATLILMFVLAPVLAWVVLGGFAIFVGLRFCALPLSIRFGMDALIANVEENGKRIESVRAIQTLKVMGAENEREGDWANKFSSTIKCNQNSALADLSFTTLQGMVEGAIRIVLIYLGVVAILDAKMSVGLFYAFLAYQTQFTFKAGALFDQVIRWRMTDMYSHRLADIVLTPKEEGIDAAVAGQPEIIGELEFRSLGFSYGPREPYVFAGVSFSVKCGEYVAIVGPSGAGKSTLLKVLCGLYPASQGEVLVDGRPLSWWGPKSVRRALGVVMQDDELLSGTIADNVAFFDEEVEMQRVWVCLRQAAMMDDVMNMPLRAETMIGDMGSSLSGGQKQRLLLARALYRRPKILVLDEATSHLDVAREGEINAALKALSITRIIVAHRQETIDSADRVIRLENGRVVSDRELKKSSLILHGSKLA
ncbi:ABC transporter ATP-binding protein [Massilia violaceinigra]|uniref:Cyclolysin secretion/processing ATP-binding protein CyaB n=1 Tax=Massilia violaceinigra TaxID=2045208 RepID=A0A2D2DR83_9BURK|nr:peptidase domain-containing ABC transporter [Massilia violaceinigra]ATQ77480.1 ABC transporter ATP-binding protein [Massilia violaceinigra]